VTFDHPPINAITATTVEELAELVELVEEDADLNVVVFDSANPAFYLTHDGTEHDRTWYDVLARLSRAPAVSIAAIRGHVRGAGVEFVLACDLRFASPEHTRLGRCEAASGPVSGGGSMARLTRLAGRGRALEVLLIADDELDDEVERIASRLAHLDHDTIARTKSAVG
jgi:enoyl-CoA hydratase/carnithine racemase